MTHRHVMPCSCVGTCGIAIVTEWDDADGQPEEWFVEFFENISHQPRLRDRLRIAWGVLRGREPYTHCVSLLHPEIVSLRDFLNERTGQDRVWAELVMKAGEGALRPVGKDPSPAPVREDF